MAKCNAPTTGRVANRQKGVFLAGSLLCLKKTFRAKETEQVSRFWGPFAVHGFFSDQEVGKGGAGGRLIPNEQTRSQRRESRGGRDSANFFSQS